eukprot:3051233-Amphidinium_carterae.2
MRASTVITASDWSSDLSSIARRSADALVENVAVCAAILKVNSCQFLPSLARSGGRPNLESNLNCPLGTDMCSAELCYHVIMGFS